MIRLSREQRDILRAEVAVSLDGIGDLSIVFDEGVTFNGLVALRRRYTDALHLADDLGWEQDDPRTVFYVTLPPERFAEWLRQGDEAATETVQACKEMLESSPGKIAPLFGFYGNSAEEVRSGVRNDADNARRLSNTCRAVLQEVA